jgi:hypothetical protein
MDAPVRIHRLYLRPLREEDNGSNACHNADARPTLRHGGHRMSLPAPLDAPAGSAGHLGLSASLAPPLLGAVYRDAMAGVASAERWPRPASDPRHPCLSRLGQMGGGWVTLAGGPGPCTASGGSETPRDQGAPWQRDPHRGQNRGGAVGTRGTHTSRGRQASPSQTTMPMCWLPSPWLPGRKRRWSACPRA